MLRPIIPSNGSASRTRARAGVAADSPEEGNQAVADALGVGSVAREFALQEPLLDEYTQDERGDRDDGEQGRGVRFQPKWHPHEKEQTARVHRMPHHAIHAGFYHDLLSFG